MVTAAGPISQPIEEGDGVARPYHYANWRTDKEPSPGYSHELMSKDVPASHFDNLGDIKHTYKPECDTLLKFFKSNV